MELKAFVTAFKKAQKKDMYLDFTLEIENLSSCNLVFRVINKDGSYTKYTTEPIKLITENINSVFGLKAYIGLREPIVVLAFLEGMLKGKYNSIHISGNRKFPIVDDDSIVQHFIKGYSEFTADRSIQLKTMVEQHSLSTFN